MFFFKRKKKITPPYERTPDEVAFQVYEIQEKKEEVRTGYQRSRFVSPIFGSNVKDEVVIPIRTKNQHNLDSLDPFRTRPRLSKDERIKKYGTAYPEFDLVRGKNLDEVVKGSKDSNLKTPSKITHAEIIDNNAAKEHPNTPSQDTHDENTEENTATTHDSSAPDSFKRDDTMQRYAYLKEKHATKSTESDAAADFENASDSENELNADPSQNAESSHPTLEQGEKTQEQTKDKTPEATEQSLTENGNGTKQTVTASADKYKNYQLPPLDLLKTPEEEPVDLSESIENQTARINETFNEFSIGARVYTHTQGPTVTRYEIAVEKGVKLSKITGLSDNLKMALGAKEIRIEAPIPGKKTVGIEVPNETPQTVHFRNIVNRSMFKQAAMPLTVALGLDIDGNPVYAPIKSMPHGLIAGATGSGKSVCINTVLMSLLLKYTPSELKMMLIDPKMVELTAYDGLPHLISPVINDPKAATAALNWVVDEMERRFQLFRQISARDIDSYNEKVEDASKKLPYMVIVVDELADLMMVASQYVEDAIMRITQKARACGIHLLVATQRPSTDVIKGTIKSNIPTRIAFSVSSNVDSQTIIDTPGAESLLGRGDMLYAPSGQTKQRLQGAFVSDQDIEAVTEFIRAQASQDYLFSEDSLMKSATKSIENDDLLDEVARYVVQKQEASINKISKTFSIGFNRAQRIVESLEAAGIVSGNLGSKAREVLVDEAGLENILDDLG